jgi:TusA-related sulfurtransferase
VLRGASPATTGALPGWIAMSLDDARGHVVLDTRGTFCPIPIIETSKAIANLHSGGVLEVIADDPAIEEDMPAWCRSNGHTILETRREGRDFRYLVEKA